MKNAWATKHSEAGKKILVVYVPVALTHVSKRFFSSFLAMTSPEIAEILDEKYDVKMIVMDHDKFPIDLNRNSAMDRAISDYDADFIMSCDADQVFPKNAILDLMAHISDEFPVVTGIYFRKSRPYTCVVGKFSRWSKDLELKRKSLEAEGFIDAEGNQTLYHKPLGYFDVAQPVDVFGMGCVLMRTEIFQKLKHPYFKYTNGYSTGGDFTFEGCSEDMWFCSQLKQAGVRVLCNPKVQAGHLVEKVIMGNEVDDAN